MRNNFDEPWRVFCAIELPQAIREVVVRHIARLKKAVPEAKVSWAREETLHLTLKFLGDIPQLAVENLSDAMSRAVSGLSPFSVRLEFAKVFPNHGPPRVLWIGINDLSGKLIELHRRLEDEAMKAGFEKEARRFEPHLTLARIRNPKPARTLATAHEQMKFEPVEIPVSELLVIRSRLSSEGSKYTVLSRHELRAPEKR
jgi:2'-5' RNA ligase